MKEVQKFRYWRPVNHSSIEPRSGSCLRMTNDLKSEQLCGSWFLKVKVNSLSHVWLFVTPSTVACQALLSTEFPRQEYRSGLPFPSTEDLPDPGTEPVYCLADGYFTVWPTREVQSHHNAKYILVFCSLFLLSTAASQSWMIQTKNNHLFCSQTFNLDNTLKGKFISALCSISWETEG